MTLSQPSAITHPPHVPDALVVDFDFFNLDGGSDDIHLAWWRVKQDLPPIFWTPHNGGHWVATRAEDIETIQKDYERFSHSAVRLPNLAKPVPLLPLESDPPVHAGFRMLIAPFFSPRAIAEIEAHVREVAIGIIETLRPRGQCEFVGEFAKVLPIVVFLDMMQLPQADAAILLPFAESISRSDDPEEVLNARRNVMGYLQDRVAERRANPANDPITRIATAAVGGRPLTEAEILGVCSLVLVGGLDTVASMLAFVARFLAANPGHRRRLIDDPAVIPNAVEELIRRHALVNTARQITHDFEFRGVQFKKGEQVQIPNSLFGLDPTINPDPLTVDFDRAEPRHAAFGATHHRCPGANLARRELTVFLEEWLPRIPDFEITPGAQPLLASGTVNGVRELQLTWTPA